MQLGLTRLYNPQNAGLSSQLPREELRQANYLYNRLAYVDYMIDSIEKDSEVETAAIAAGNYGSLPLLVVSAGSDSSEDWRALQAGLLSFSADSRQFTLDTATHMSIVTDPIQAQTVSKQIFPLAERLPN